MTYWENMDGQVLSPVYSLATHSQGLWLLSGLESGNIRLQSVRHDEGKEVALLKQHNSAVSVLNLTPDEKSLLSGSWDKKVFDWDLNTGQPRRTFTTSAGQISAIELRPESTFPVPQDTLEMSQPNGTYSSNNREANTSLANAIEDPGRIGEGPNQQPGSPADSLFGGAESLVGDADSLFGDADGGVADGGGPSGEAFHVDDDDEFSQALANSVQQSEGNTQMELESTLKLNGAANSETSPAAARATGPAREPGGNADNLSRSDQPETLTNGLPHAEELESGPPIQDTNQPSGSESYVVRDTTFLAASIDGTIRVWDRRQADPVARISPRNVPPWCMSACWSPDGNYIYAGRRNGTVEEFSLHKGLRNSVRSFKFPQGSGPVTALKSMPNGRHLVW